MSPFHVDTSHTSDSKQIELMCRMTGIFALDPNTERSSSEIGGKAYNLIKMLQADLPVPGGFVLSVSFFEHWINSLQSHASWLILGRAKSEQELETACNTLQTRVQTLDFDEEQRQGIEDRLQSFAEDTLFSVRSSSPHEDLESSSFAGAYESILGVPRKTLHAAIRKVFASCLDFRIALYKRQQGIFIDSPKIAVIIQQQIASEKAGVGFSVNPLNNDFDEAVFNSNWGQGETVVSGQCSPDFFIVHKHHLKRIESQIGAKETSIWLKPDGGTIKQRDPRHQEASLCEEELLELTHQLKRVETFFDQPSDIEWAFANGNLYLLQARPITTYHPLGESMCTLPGQARRLYVDITMSVQGIFEPLSPMGLSLFQQIPAEIKDELIGSRSLAPPERSLVVMDNGRLYANVLNLMQLAGPKKVFNVLAQMDPLVHKTVQELDLAPFARPQLSKLPLQLGFLFRIYRRITQVLRARNAPENARNRWRQQWEQYKSNLRRLSQQELSVFEFSQQCVRKLVQFLCRETMMLFPSAKLAMAKIRDQFPNPSEQTQTYLKKLDQGLPGNVTVEMGHALFRLHSMLAKSQATDAKTLLTAIESRSLSNTFLDAWTNFLDTYGHRGIKEIDIASPRYRDQPQVLLQQLVEFVQDGGSQPSPLERHQEVQQERREAYSALRSQLDRKQQVQFDRRYAMIENLGGLRETHKFVAIYTFDQVRQRILRESEKLAQQRRIQNIDDVFFLTLQQLNHGIKHANIDLKQQIDEGRKIYARQSQCKSAVPLMDSRGRFYRPSAPPSAAGEIVGQAVSNGIASGPAKVLHRPDGKALLPGEILVARATDPAWTPLFVNASAIVLEIGGPLQHGALVAREYGKPCVSAVQRATELFRDGELIEVDGERGVIRRISESSKAPCE